MIGGALFTEDYSEMIVIKDIDFFSLCEHHILPFFGKAHIAYIPKNKIVGISKLARLVEVSDFLFAAVLSTMLMVIVSPTPRARRSSNSGRYPAVGW